MSNPTEHDRSRRRFLCAAAATAAAAGAAPRIARPASPSGNYVMGQAARKIKLGFDNFSVRALGWKAPQLIDYAAALKVDSLFLSDLDVYESLAEDDLKRLKERADQAGLELHVGTGSICPSSATFNNKRGTADEHLALAIRVARALGSPVVRCYQGSAEDRKTPGGLGVHIKNTVQVLRNARGAAEKANVKIAVENHAGDMQAWELVELMEAAGRDFVGATMDSGNATWTLEDPLTNLEILAPYALTTGMRDSAIWEDADGAVVQWSAIGDGVVDWAAYMRRYAELCPQTVFQLEIISGFPRRFSYRREDFWKNYRDVRGYELQRFQTLAARGRQASPYKAPEGVDKRTADQNYQKEQLERSVRYCRETLGLGLKE